MIWDCIFIVVFNPLIVQSMEWNYLPLRTTPFWSYFMPPFYHEDAFQAEPTAMELMVDLTNTLGITVFQEHFHSSGNFAFSPYGMVSVLVVLYEGACGESAKQIQKIVGFPSNKDIIRIGFKDIHRHLRSYFNHEGFLSGIALNKEISSLNPEYKKILKFYGYDVDLSVGNKTNANGGKSTTTTHKPAKSTGTSGIQPSKAQTTGSVASASSGSTTEFSSVKEVVSTPDYVSTTTGRDESEILEIPASTRQTHSPPTEGTTLSSDEPTTSKSESSTGDTTLESLTTTLKTEKPPETTTALKEFKESKTENELSTTSKETEINEIQSTAMPFTTEPTTKAFESESEIPLQETTTAENNPEVASALDNGMLIPQAVDFEETTNLLSTANIKGFSEVSSTESNTETKSQTVTITSDVDTTTQSNPQGETLSTVRVQTTEMKEEKTTVTVEMTVSTSENVKSTFFTDQTTTPNIQTTNIPTSTEGNPPEGTDSTTDVTEPSVLDSTLSAKPNSITTTEETVNETTYSTPKDNDDSTSTVAYGTTVTNETSTLPESVTVTSETQTASTKDTTTTDVNFDFSTPITSTKLLYSTSTGSYDTTTLYDTTTGSEEFLSTTEKTVSHLKKRRRSLLLSTSNNVQFYSKAILKRSTFIGSNDTDKLLIKDKRRKRTILDYFKSSIGPDLSFQLHNGMFNNHISKNVNSFRRLPRHLFLVDGIIDTFVPMMTYTNVFRFGYIPTLHSKALEFPLDDTRYKLLILLPFERRGFRQLLHDLRGCSLREIVESIRPAKVRATIPTFMVEGFVILTPTLKKLGIRDVFDPRRSNLSGMSNDPELYVRNVEQFVTVVIRNYVEILDVPTRTLSGRQFVHDFEVSHPFLYFVLDSATNVALMAGQVLDPLNSRLY